MVADYLLLAYLDDAGRFRLSAVPLSYVAYSSTESCEVAR